MDNYKFIEVKSDEHHEWTNAIWVWITGFMKRYKRSLPESQEDMLKYNTENVDVSEIMDALTSKEAMISVCDRIPAVIYPPSTFRIDEERDYLFVPYPKREEVTIIDVSTLTLNEIKTCISQMIKDNPLGFAIGVGFKRDAHHDSIVYVYKPVPAFGMSVNVYK